MNSPYISFQAGGSRPPLNFRDVRHRLEDDRHLPPVAKPPIKIPFGMSSASLKIFGESIFFGEDDTILENVWPKNLLPGEAGWNHVFMASPRQWKHMKLAQKPFGIASCANQTMPNGRSTHISVPTVFSYQCHHLIFHH